MERWSLAEIHEALGDDAVAILPPLLTLRVVTVRLPEYVLRALETIASDAGKSLDDCLYGELTDFAGSVSTRVADRIPGYRRAYLFPGLVACKDAIGTSKLLFSPAWKSWIWGSRTGMSWRAAQIGRASCRERG